MPSKGASLDLFIDLPVGRYRKSAGIQDALREAIRSGRLSAGSALPSTRALARDLGLARSTVVEAYTQLAAEGYLLTRRGAETTVSDAARSLRPVPAPAAGNGANPAPPRFDFRPGLPDLSRFPRHIWARMVRRALAELPDAEFGYGDVRGHRALRVAVSDYLNRVRGLATSPDSILTCAGFTQALNILCSALRATGVTRVGVEDPGRIENWSIIASHGLHPVGVPVDHDGLRIDTLDNLDCQAVVVTPAHQFPTGSTLAPARRQQLLAWAANGHRWVIEDDYDAEFRYDRQPVGALAGLDPDHVVTAGTVSKTLAPDLRLGWLVLPDRLAPTVLDARRRTHSGCPVVLQAALADMIASGQYDRHVRRMRGLYQRRRDAVHALLARTEHAEAAGLAAGLHLVALLPDRAEMDRWYERAAAHEVGLYPLDRYTYAADKRPGFVLGYGAVPEHRFAAALHALHEVIC